MDGHDGPKDDEQRERIETGGNRDAEQGADVRQRRKGDDDRGVRDRAGHGDRSRDRKHGKEQRQRQAQPSPRRGPGPRSRRC